MSKQANPVKVGAFVLGGLIVLIVAIGLVGSSTFWTSTTRMVTYFDGSVNGLVQGSPVKFRGVTIGQVANISLEVYSPERALIPVVLEIDEQSFRQLGDGLSIMEPEGLRQAIDSGLRASLELESFVTGRLFLSLDIYPEDDSEPAYRGDGSLPEIPTRTAGLEKLLQSLKDVDVAGMGSKLTEILDKLNLALEQLNVGELNEKLNRLLASADAIVSSPKIIATVDSFRTTADKASRLLDDLDAEIGPLGEELKAVGGSATETMSELRLAIDDLRRVLASESPLMGELTRAMDEISDAARSLRLLADELARDPSVLIKGRATSER